jgi:predicted sugar kinase
LLAQVPVPPGWRILVVLPPGESGMAGASELDAFARLERPRPAISDALCRLLVMGVLPALAESDFAAFSESIFEFNAGAGELFAPVQGDVYSNARTASLVEWLRREGVVGAGQSSWGPGVFGFVEDEGRGVWLRDRLAGAFPAARIWLTSARERGADLAEESPS